MPIPITRFAPPDRDESYSKPALELLRRTLGAAVGFCPYVAPEEDASTIEGVISAYMRERFDVDCYQARVEDERRLRSQFRPGRITAFVGERGSGKTTLLRRLAARLSASTSEFTTSSDTSAIADSSTLTEGIVYVDLLEVAIPTGPQCALACLRVLYRQLQREFIENPNSKIAALWNSYQAANSVAFEEFQSFARIHYPKDDPLDWLAIADERLRDLHKVGLQRTRSDLHILGSTSEFIIFLATLPRHRVHIVVDNLDLLDTEDQISIGAELARVVNIAGRTPSCTMAMRRSSLAKIVDHLERSSTALGVVDAVLLAVTANGPHELDATPSNLIQKFISSRLQVVHDLAETLTECARADHEEDVVEQFAACLTRVGELLAVLLRLFTTRGAQGVTFVEMLNDWHNGSLREIGTTTHRMLYDAIRDAHPLSPYSDLKALLASGATDAELDGDWMSTSRVLVRVHLFTKFFFAGPHDSRVPPSLPHARESHPIDRHLGNVKMRILDYLVAVGRPVLLVELRSVFERFDVPPNVVDEQARVLAAPRDTNDSGLIWINRGGFSVGIPDREAARIEIGLQPAGEFLHRRFCTKAEYLFWCAAQDPAGWPSFADSLAWYRLHVRGLSTTSSGLLAAELDDASVVSVVPQAALCYVPFRIMVAASHLGKAILERYVAENHRTGAISSPSELLAARARANTLRDTFGRLAYPERARQSITTFIGELRTAGADRISDIEIDEIRRLLLPVRDHYTTMHRLAAAG